MQDSVQRRGLQPFPKYIGGKVLQPKIFPNVVATVGGTPVMQFIDHRRT